MPTGVLPKQILREVFEAGWIAGVGEEYLNPASIDMPLSNEAYRLDCTFLAHAGEVVREVLPKLGAQRHDFSKPFEKGVSYLVRVEGEWSLPPNVYAYVNPKSSTGRLNLFCRSVADRVDMYDALQGPGWKGEHWVLICPSSFPVLLNPGIAVSQVRLFDGKSFLDELQANNAIKKHGLIFDEGGARIDAQRVRRQGGAFLLTLYVGEHMGWECRGTNKVLDLAKIGHYEPRDFFEPISPQNGELVLRKGSFYIFTTAERVMVSPSFSAELRATDARFGEFRVHAAGYVDPGWGWGRDGGECGRPITLEVVPHEDMLVRNGQVIARIRYERMKEEPEVHYDDVASNYVQQRGAKLSKHFKSV